MSEVVEILLTSDISGSNTSSAWDSRTGTNLMTYKGGGASQAHGLSLLRNEFLVSANSTKPLIHIYPINSQEQIQNIRFVAPGKVSALAASPDGNFLVAGIQQTIHIWQICSGRMLAALSKHYQNVTTIKFTDDGSHFVSAGQDGCVLVWNLTRVISQHKNDQDPFYSFNDHALPVTDIHVGHSGMRAFLCTVSSDRTCRIYDLASGSMLLNVVFVEALQSVAVNIIETNAYVGTSEGSIFEINIQSPPRTKEYHMTKDDYTNRFTGSKGSVTCLALSLDGETLASGGHDEIVRLWHIPSRQLIRTIPHKGHISNVLFKLTPKKFLDQEVRLTLIAQNLKRMMDNQSSEDNQIVEIFIKDTLDEESFETHSHGQAIAATTVNKSDNSKDVDDLRNEIRRLKKVNKELFEHCVKTISNNTLHLCANNILLRLIYKYCNKIILIENSKIDSI